jgi:hypothetical protein
VYVLILVKNILLLEKRDISHVYLYTAIQKSSFIGFYAKEQNNLTVFYLLAIKGIN